MSLKPVWTFVGYLFWWIFLTILSPFFITTFGLLLFGKFLVVEPLARFTLSKRVRSLNPFDAILATDGFWDRPLSTLGQLMVLEGSLDVEKVNNTYTEILATRISSTRSVQNICRISLGRCYFYCKYYECLFFREYLIFPVLFQFY
jgi:hypothetical protein